MDQLNTFKLKKEAEKQQKFYQHVIRKDES
jgi:hypothetical protein